MGAFAKPQFLHRDTSLPAELIGRTDDLRLSLIHDQPGLVEFPGSPAVVVSLHVGPSVSAECRRGGERHVGTTIHGDLEIIPPNTPGVWEIKSSDSALVIGIKLRLLQSIVEQSGADPAGLRITNRFQARDPQIEHLGWALKAEMESGYPCGRVYTDSLATALAARIVRNHSSLANAARGTKAAIPARRLKNVLAYIEDNLARDLTLQEIADAAGFSTSHFKALFRKSMGMPPHQYLIRRRVERAAAQLRKGDLPIGQIALDNGFCHQSHLALHIRRVLGVSPQEIRDNAC
jgi:AraC family transcriptional regulator